MAPGLPPQNKIQQQIQSNIANIQKEASAGDALEKIDSARFHDNLLIIREGLASQLSFESYKRSLQAIKARHGHLSEATETLFKQRCDQNVSSYAALASATSDTVDMLAQAGLDTILDRQAATLFWQFQMNPASSQIADLLRENGVSDSDIHHYSAWLKSSKGDILRFPGGDGTVKGMANATAEQLQLLQQMSTAAQLDGVPMLEGSGGSGGTAGAVATVVVVVAILVCLWFIPGCFVVVTVGG